MTGNTNDAPRGGFEWANDTERQATEEHSAKSTNTTPKQQQLLSCVQKIRRVFQLLKYILSFMFFSASEAPDDITEGPLHIDSDNVCLLQEHTRSSNDDEYNNVFQQKIMCMETMGMPRSMIERYKNVHDPETVEFVDDAVHIINEHRVTLHMLKDIRECKSDDILKESDEAWEERLNQHRDIISLNADQLINKLTGTKKRDKLVHMVDATAQRIAEAQSTRDLIDLNKSMIAASRVTHTVNQVVSKEPSQGQHVAWTPIVTEQDIKGQQAIIKQTGSQKALLA